MTRFEKIKQMNIEQVTEFILKEFRIDCASCEGRNDVNGCRHCIKTHLESEVEE